MTMIKLGSGALNAIYPVGSVYMSINSTDPGELFGGTWEQIKDRFLLACGDNYQNGAAGGEATHTLTINEMPSHTHDVKQRESSPAPVSSFYNNVYTEGGIEHVLAQSARITINQNATDHLFNTNTGGGQAHNNMPPYLAVYMWKRTA